MPSMIQAEIIIYKLVRHDHLAAITDNGLTFKLSPQSGFLIVTMQL